MTDDGRLFAEKVTTLLSVLHRELVRQQRGFLSKGDLSIPQAVILDLLAERRHCRMKDIALALGRPKSAVTVMVDRLLALGLVRRVHSAADRRVVDVSLTPRGRSVVGRIVAEKRTLAERLFAPLAPAERRAYFAILTKIVDHIHKP